jgi:transcriptional regulator with XRE-family HTH domain
MNTTAIQLTSPDEISLLLAQRIKESRLLAGWKQSTLAARAGVSLPTLRRFERTGQSSLENVLKLCHAIGRLDEFSNLLRPPPARSIAELERNINRPIRKRGRR